jgi:hypothetical protein
MFTINGPTLFFNGSDKQDTHVPYEMKEKVGSNFRQDQFLQSSYTLFHQSMFKRINHCLGAVLYLKFAEDVADMRFDRF